MTGLRRQSNIEEVSIRRRLGSSCYGWSGLSRFCAHANSNTGARVESGADRDTYFYSNALAYPNCYSDINSDTRA